MTSGITVGMAFPRRVTGGDIQALVSALPAGQVACSAPLCRRTSRNAATQRLDFYATVGAKGRDCLSVKALAWHDFQRAAHRGPRRSTLLWKIPGGTHDFCLRRRPHTPAKARRQHHWLECRSRVCWAPACSGSRARGPPTLKVASAGLGSPRYCSLA